MRLRPGSAPDPVGELTALPRRSSWIWGEWGRRRRRFRVDLSRSRGSSSPVGTLNGEGVMERATEGKRAETWGMKFKGRACVNWL